MFNKKPHCAVRGTDSRPKLGENASVMYVKNTKRKEYVTIQIDGCEIVEGRKCDKAIHLTELNQSLLVELKGSDISHAAKQLEETLQHYNMRHSAGVKCFIISSNNPLSSPQSQNLRFRFKKNNGVELFIHRSGFEYCYT